MATANLPRLDDALLGVIPVVQTQARGPWTLTLVSIELWERGAVASFDTMSTDPRLVGDQLAPTMPHLRVTATDARGVCAKGALVAGYGGGPLHDFQARDVLRFVPPFRPIPGDLEVSVLISLGQLVTDGRGVAPVTVWSDPEPWRFTVVVPPLAAAPPEVPNGDGAAATLLPAPPYPGLRRLEGVMPIVQAVSDSGWDLTAIALERSDDGFTVTFRMAGDARFERGLYAPNLRVWDDHGHAYHVIDGTSTGEIGSGGPRSRNTVICAPALDPAARRLAVVVDGIRLDAYDPIAQTLATDQVIPGRWAFGVALPADPAPTRPA